MSNLMTPISVLRESIEAGLVALRQSNFPLLSILTKRSAFQDNVKWNVDVTTTAAAGISGLAAAPAPSSDTVVGASLAIGAARFAHTIRLTKNDVTQAAAIGVEPLTDLFRSHVDVAIQRIMLSVSQNLYTGVGTTATGGMVGLGTAALGTGAYAGLNPATTGQEGWVSSQQTATIASIDASPVALETLFRNLKNGVTTANGLFDLIVCNPTFLARYEAAYIANPKDAILTGQAALLASLGYNVYQYAGRPIVGDNSCPANVAYALDTQSADLYTRQTSETQAMSGLNVVVGQIASDTATAMVFEVAVFPQLVLKNRLNLGRILLT